MAQSTLPPGIDGSTYTLAQIGAKDVNRIKDNVMLALRNKSVWPGIFTSGDFPSGMGDQLRNIVQLPSYSPDGYVQPGGVPFAQSCGYQGETEKTGSVSYQISLNTLRGRGPVVCVSQGYGTFKSSMAAAEDSIKQGILLKKDKIDRYNAWKLSGSKYLCLSTLPDISDRIAGGSELTPAVLPIASLPDSGITFQALQRLVTYAKESMLAEDFTLSPSIIGKGGYEQKAIFITSQETIESFRREGNVQEDMRALTTGGFKYGEKAISSYAFQTAGAWQGVAMGADNVSLRYNDLLPDGTPNFIEPYIENVIDAAAGTSSRKANPVWQKAKFEIGFLIFKDTLKRLVPTKYTGEGTMKFDPRLSNGTLEWVYRKDMMQNVFGDFGFHIYGMDYGFEMIRPHHLIAIQYARCPVNDLVKC